MTTRVPRQTRVAHGRHGAARAPLLATQAFGTSTSYPPSSSAMTNTSSGSACATRRRAKCRSSRSAWRSTNDSRPTTNPPSSCDTGPSAPSSASRIAGRRSRRRDGSDVRAKTSPAGSTLAGDGGGRAHRRASRIRRGGRRLCIFERRRRGGTRAAVEAGRLAPLMDPDARLDVLRSAQLSADAHARVVRATTRATGKGAPRSSSCWAETPAARGAWTPPPRFPAADLRRWKPPRRREEGRGARKRGGIRQEGRRGEREEEYAGVLG